MAVTKISPPSTDAWSLGSASRRWLGGFFKRITLGENSLVKFADVGDGGGYTASETVPWLWLRCSLTASRTILLPSSPREGDVVSVSDETGAFTSSVVATVSDPDAAGKISGEDSFSVDWAWATVHFVWTGNVWKILSDGRPKADFLETG